MDSYKEWLSPKQLGTFVYIALMLLQQFVSPSWSVAIHVPLRRATGVERYQNHQQSERAEGQGHRMVKSVTQPMEGISGEGYYIDMNIGTPPQQMQILVDTGSSNFALAASPDPHISHFFNSSQSSTYVEQGEHINVPYTQGEWDGLLCTDVVTLTSLPNVTLHPNIAFIHHSTGFFIPESNWQGIVGMAYQSIARPDTLKPFWNTVRDEAGIDDIFSMQLCGTAHSHNTSGRPAMEGNLILGGVSKELYEGPVFYTPIVKEMYYEVVISDISVAGRSLRMDCKEYNFDKTIVDSGTTHLRLPTRVFHEVVREIKSVLQTQDLDRMPVDGFWSGQELLCWTDLTTAFGIFPKVSLSLVSSQGHNQFFTLHLTSQHYLRSVEDTAYFGTPRSCLKFGISPSDTGTVLGALLMESFFVVFDRSNKQMGFAQTTCPPPYPGSKSSAPVIDGLHSAQGNLTLCLYQRATQDDSTLLVVTYVMATVCLVCALPLIIVVIQWQVRKFTNRGRCRQDPEAETVLSDNR